MRKYEELIKANEIEAEEENKLYSLASSGIKEMANDETRIVETYKNVEDELNSIDERFRFETGLNKTDVAFLMLATALQVSRWIILSKLNDEITNKVNTKRIDHDDKEIKLMEKEKRNEYKKDYIDKHGDTHKKSKHRDWANIVFDSVPYDITRGSKDFHINMEAGFHRLHTLGHDPVLGWVVGTMNILSDTITLDKTYLFQTFVVEMMEKPKRWVAPTTIINSLTNCIDSIKEDKTRLPAAVFAQGLHLKSDEYTKLGLPIPVLEAFDPELASRLYKEGYDSLMLLKDVQPFLINGLQAIVSIFINMLISLIHGLFYNRDKYKSRDLYEVKTRKILSISNSIATSSNLIWVGGNLLAENPSALNDLDIGGLLVTIYRLISDTSFIYKIKKEFLESEWSKKVVGEEYSFMKGDIL